MARYPLKMGNVEVLLEVKDPYLKLGREYYQKESIYIYIYKGARSLRDRRHEIRATSSVSTK